MNFEKKVIWVKGEIKHSSEKSLELEVNTFALNKKNEEILNGKLNFFCSALITAKQMDIF